MKSHFLISVLVSSCIALTNLHANEIRLYQESDHAILRDMLAKNEELLVPGNDLEGQVSETERFLSSKNYITKVYIKNNEPVAFITYVKNGFEAPLVNFNNPTKPPTSVLQGVIQLLSVQKKYHRQGIGKTLVENALEDMKSKKIKSIFLQTKVDNSASRSLYEKVGFELQCPIIPGITDCFYRLTSPA